MPADHVLAEFGAFEKSGSGRVVYTAALFYDTDGKLLHNWYSEYADDLNALRKGNVEILY